MNKLTIIVLLLVSYSAMGQKINLKIDKLYGDTSYTTDDWALYEKKMLGERIRSLSVSIVKSKAGYMFILTGYQAMNDVILTRKDDMVHFKLANGDIIDCPLVSTDFNSNSIRYDYSLFTVGCSVPDSAISQFISNHVSLIRVEHSDGYYDYEVGKKFSNNISFLLRKMKEKYPNL